MNRLQLFSLANHLATYITVGADDCNGCDHTLRRTLGWINDQGFDRGPMLEWLQHRGGWCDCSVVCNIYLATRDERDEHTPPLPVSALYAWTPDE